MGGVSWCDVLSVFFFPERISGSFKMNLKFCVDFFRCEKFTALTRRPEFIFTNMFLICLR